MTGFARVEGGDQDFSWTWELRSVNGKGLDIRFRIPSGFEAAEIPARKLTQKHLKRGNVQIGLQVQRLSDKRALRVDENLLEELISISENLRSRVGGDLPGVADLLGVRGVVELEEYDDLSISDETISSVLNTLGAGLDDLRRARGNEGAGISKVLLEQVDAIEALLGTIEADPSRTPEKIQENLKILVRKLLSDNAELDSQRLHQEAVLLATKADITEEADRLSVHVEAARKLIREGGAVGRKLDFLAQEFNRECNTICSKSNSAAVTAAGLDMKLIIDQFREQLQNME